MEADGDSAARVIRARSVAETLIRAICNDERILLASLRWRDEGDNTSVVLCGYGSPDAVLRFTTAELMALLRSEARLNIFVSKVQHAIHAWASSQPDTSQPP